MKSFDQNYSWGKTDIVGNQWGQRILQHMRFVMFCVCGISIGLCAHCLTVAQHVTHQSFKVTLRIVSMMQKGELDTSVAMHLLGKGGLAESTRGGGGTKRPSSAADPKSPEDGSPDGDGEESWDEILQQAKKAKLEPQLNLMQIRVSLQYVQTCCFRLCFPRVL